MTDRNKGSSNRKNAAGGPERLPAVREKTVVAIFTSRNCVPSCGAKTARATAWNKMFPGNLCQLPHQAVEEILNETIYPGRLHRRGACSFGDGGICNAARSGKRHCRRRQRRRCAGKGRTWPWPRSYGPRRPRSSLWMGPRTRSSSSPSLIPPQGSTFGDLLRIQRC
jgi:hypothetical protein